MSVLVRFTPASASTEQYDESIRRLEATGEFPPDGLEYHVGFLVDGQIRVSEIWTSMEQFEAFGATLMPILSEIGIDPGKPQFLTIHNVLNAQAAKANA